MRWLNPKLAPLLLGNPACLANPSGYVLVLPDGTRINPVLAPEHAVGYGVSRGAAATCTILRISPGANATRCSVPACAWQPFPELMW